MIVEELNIRVQEIVDEIARQHFTGTEEELVRYIKEKYNCA